MLVAAFYPDGVAVVELLKNGRAVEEDSSGTITSGEQLIDIEESFQLLRFRHMKTVERIIGFKRGTGGTGGVSYLRKMLDVVLFPEIWKLRTDL